MSINCSNCGSVDVGTGKFCAHCGARTVAEVKRQEGIAVGIGLSEGMRAGVPFSDAELGTQRELLKESESNLAVAFDEVKADRRKKGIIFGVIGGLVGYSLGELQGTLFFGGIGFAYFGLRRDPLRRISQEKPTAQERSAAQVQSAFERERDALQEMERRVAAFHRANPS